MTTFTGDDLLVSGRFKKAGKKRFVLVLVIKDRASGTTIDTKTIRTRTPTLDAGAEGTVAAAFADAAAKPRDVAPESGPTTKPESVAQPEPPSKPPTPEPPKQDKGALLPPGPLPESKERSADPKELLAPGSEVNASEPPPPQQAEPPPTVARANPPPEPPTRRRDVRAYRFEIALGAALVERTLQFTHDAAITDVPVGYDGTPVAGARASAEIFPFALGVAGEIERFTLRSQFATGETFDSTHMKWSAGLRLRWNIGSRPTLPTLTFGAGYGQLTFSFDTMGAGFDLPNVQYNFIDPGLRVRLPLFTRALALRLEGRYLYVLDSGQFQAAGNYGGTSFTGFDASAGLELRPFKGLVIQLIAELSQIDMTFDGTGSKTTMRDADPDQDVTSARDQYWGGYATLGWSF